MKSISVKPHEKVDGVYWIGPRDGEKRLGTLSQAPGTSVYGETTHRLDGVEYRLWDPFRSKLAAAILKGLSQPNLGSGSRVLYLGAASGTTVSHVSDIVGSKGHVYCVEFAQRSFRDLVENVCKQRTNMTPIFEDARFPGRYRSIVQQVDCVYCDVAQPDQGRILAENADIYLADDGGFLFAVKARSIDVTRNPSELYREEANVLVERGYEIVDMIRLDPFEMDHCMLSGRKKRSEHGVQG